MYFANEPLIRVTAAADRGSAAGDAALEPDQLPDDGRHEGGPHRAGGRAAASPGAGERVIDFSPRRDHGADAAMKVARSAAVAGCGGTSNVAAAMRYGLRPVGTMAHSYVLSFDSEQAAFRSFMEDFPETAVLLVDTYDTAGGRAQRDRSGARDRNRAGRVSGSTPATCSSYRRRRGGCSTRRG